MNKEVTKSDGPLSVFDSSRKGPLSVFDSSRKGPQSVSDSSRNGPQSVSDSSRNGPQSVSDSSRKAPVKSEGNNKQEQVDQWKKDVMDLEKEICNPPLLLNQPGCVIENPPQYIKNHQEEIAELKKKIHEKN
jgi:hypothetical protein